MRKLLSIIMVFSFAPALGMLSTTEQVEQDKNDLGCLIVPAGFNAQRLCNIIERGIAGYLLRFYLNHLFNIHKIDPAFVNGQDDCGYTPLHWAAKTLNAGAIEVLLAFHARIDLKNEHGKTPYSLGLDNFRSRESQIYHLHLRPGSEKYTNACIQLRTIKKAIDSLRNPNEEVWGMTFH